MNGAELGASDQKQQLTETDKVMAMRRYSDLKKKNDNHRKSIKHVQFFSEGYMKLLSQCGLVIFSSLVAFSSTVFAQDLFNKDSLFSPNQPIKFELFQKIEPMYTIGGHPLIALGNDLSLVRLKVLPSTLGTPLGYAYFFDIRDNKFFASLDVEANLESGRGGDWTDEPCKRTDFLWKRSTGGTFKNINCASINHLTKYWANPSGEFAQLLVAVREKNLEIPPTILQVAFTTYRDQSRRIVYKVNINPEYFGIERDAEQNWGASSWHKTFLNKDPKKAEFILRLSEWAILVQDRMDMALENDKNAFNKLPFLEGFLKETKAANAARESTLSSASFSTNKEKELSEAKALFDKGLINKDAYEKLVNKTLGL